MVVGALVVIMILRVYGLYRIMKINRSVMTPMLLVGLFIALSGITELTEDYLGEFGVGAHSIAMLLTGVSFAYGIYSYHQMLNRATKLR
jgi:hypothetical protein